MPTPLFFALPEDKRAAILRAGLTEFAALGYTDSSTNRIVRNAGISKGSLFKYFSGKEDLYFYLLDLAAADLTESLSVPAAAPSPDLFQRVLDYSALEFSWYIQHPEKARFLIRAFSACDGPDAALRRKTDARYGAQKARLYAALTGSIDPKLLRGDKEKTLALMKWVLDGFNEDFRRSHPVGSAPMEQLQAAYRRSLREYLDLLRPGLLRQEED